MNIVFDLDGTLIDSAPDIQAVANAVLDAHGAAGISLEETRRFIGEGAAVFVRKMMAARAMDTAADAFDQLHQAFLEQYSHAVDKAVFYPHVEETLAGLKQQGYRLGLCTNKPEQPARAVVEHMQLNRFMEGFVAGGMAPSRKPDPEMLLLAAATLGEGPTLYVGDSEIDAETALRARIPFALFTEGYRKTAVAALPHDYAFSDFRELPEIVRRVLPDGGAP